MGLLNKSRGRSDAAPFLRYHHGQQDGIKIHAFQKKQTLFTMNKKQTKLFDAGSPGFLYTVIVSILTIFAAAGVSFPDNPADIAGEFTTLLSTGGFYAVLGVIATSIGFPLWNAYQKKQFNFNGIFSSTLTWIALANIVFGALALTGFTLPDGTVDALVAAVLAKDWGAIISMLFTTIIPTVVRFIKDRKQTT